MKIESSVFKHNEYIPFKYTCEGDRINPPLIFEEIPVNTSSLVLIMDDPDAPMGTFIHWIVYNIEPNIFAIDENSIPKGAEEGLNTRGNIGYTGPCPPTGTHRYYFKVFALDTKLNIQKPTVEEIVREIKNHILDQAEIIGLYKKQKNM